ncbi:procathepsin L-like [Symsagittifera roscoffensis]|uniref:procathepsin L-like n=1 Tax=Symsagittifera roscoffensis TaxID=84072 RepID=UPI00307BA48E
MNLIVVLAVALPMTLSAVPLSLQRDPHAELFDAWKVKFEKKYDSGVEEVTRFGIWKDNMEKVMLHNLKYNLGLTTFTLEMNLFADLTSEEFAAQRLGMRQIVKTQPGFDSESGVLSNPTSKDWRDDGWVTGVKDQGQCGSCWSFSTTGSMEGQHKNASGTLVSLSEQQLVDCDTYDYGCNGGLMSNAVLWLSQNQGSISEDDYPYVGYQQSCKASGMTHVAQVSSYFDITSGSESRLEDSIASVGPCSIAIDASHFSFQLYSGGVYFEPSCSSYRLDHGVLAVGYNNEDADQKYWIVKNSWGTSWGEQGYIKMAKDKSNNCGVATQAGYPVV